MVGCLIPPAMRLTPNLSTCGNAPGVAFSWEHVNPHLGLGYSTWWLPLVELPLTTPKIIPDLSF